MDSIIEFDHISVQFPSVMANDDVSLSIKKGEVFALVGENGAGKSTLMNVLYGITEPTAGSVYVRGEKVTRFSPAHSIKRGIGMVHQHFMLVPSFTVTENIMLSREPRRFFVFNDRKKAKKAVRELSEKYSLHADPDARVCDISVGSQQRVEILKALCRGANILILDEPTAVLTPQETDELFSVIRRMVHTEGMTVIIITHKLNEVMAISDRVAVMRAGKLVGVKSTSEVNERMLASMMVGRDMLFDALEKTGAPGNTALNVSDLTVRDNRGLMAVKGVSFSLHKNEILGIAAIEGNGQSELAEALTGLRGIDSGTAEIAGTDIRSLDPAQIRALGLAHIPEDRISTGVSVDASVSDNLIVGRQRAREFSTKLGYMRTSSVERYAHSVFDRFDIRASGVDERVGSLSGGNMQKVVVAREFSFDAPVLIISQPTRGVDIGAIESIHKLIIEKRNAGAAILLISADLDEVFRLSDRVITMYSGTITGEFASGAIDRASVGLCMTGKGDTSYEQA